MDSSLIALKENIIAITAKIDNSLESLFFSCEQLSVAQNLKKRIQVNEVEINKLCQKSLFVCLQILEINSPKGKDLRFVIASMRMIREMQRIADHIVAVSRWVHKIPAVQLSFIVDMLREISLMNRTVMDAYVLERVDLAEQTIRNDQVINDFNRRMIKSFLRNDLDIENIKQGYYSTRIAKSIERIGDYIKNIAEEVMFIENDRDFVIFNQVELKSEETHPFS